MRALTKHSSTVKTLIIRAVHLKSTATQQNGKVSVLKFTKLNVNQLIIWSQPSRGAFKIMLRIASKQQQSSAHWTRLEQQETYPRSQPV